jgi:gliding motility-associated-like protein
MMLMVSSTMKAQLVVNSAQSPQQLVEDVLIGQGVEVSNIQFTGDPMARGYFNGANSNIGLAEGVILSTGNVLDAIGPNGTPFSDQGTDFNRPGYPALTALSGSIAGTKDAAVLEFDFVPSSDTIQFRYKFASNEYMLYVGAGVNDVFAFLISGPGIAGEQNIALIPGTTTPVAIDNVNANTNSQYYISNENPPGQTVEYNGFTTVFTALAILTPCETYHIKLAIADAGDGLYDSAVFLEAGSFSSPTVSIDPSTNFSASQSDLVLIEGCSQLTLSFERSAPFDAPLTVGITHTGTATMGVDYTGIGNTITFPAGQATLVVNVQIVDDGVAEGDETVSIALQQVNPCATGPVQTVDFTIRDAVRPTVTTSPSVTLYCPSDYVITATVTGGYPDFSYTWSGMPGQNSESITVSPLTTTNYTVNVTDACGFTASSSTNITMTGYVPVAVTVADVQVCNGGDAEVAAVVTGGGGTITYLWNTGQTTATYQANPDADAQVWVTVTDSCGLSATDTALLSVDDFEASFTYDHERHDYYLFLNTSPEVQTVYWDFGDGTTSTELDPAHLFPEAGYYTVSLTAVNVNGCESSYSELLEAYPPMRVYLPNSFTPNGDGLNDMFGMTGEAYAGYTLRIYTRWGQEIYKGVHYDADAWDGTVDGQLVPRGLYLWKVEVLPPAGMNVLKEGTVMVLPD